MKEQIGNSVYQKSIVRLTNEAKKPYSKSGDIFMAEPGKVEIHQNNAPDKNFIKPNEVKGSGIPNESARQVPPELAERAWKAHYQAQGIDFDALPQDERSVVGMAIKEGRIPGEESMKKISKLMEQEVEQPEAVKKRIEEGHKMVAMAQMLNPLEFPDLGAIVNEINAEAGSVPAGNLLSPMFLDEQIKRIRELIDQKKVDTIQATNLLNKLNPWMREAIAARGAQERGDRFGFYLQTEDLKLLNENPILWLDKQFDTLYNLAQEGQELTSPVINNMQTVVAEAIRYVQYNNKEALDRFQRLFTIRFNLIQMRTTIGYKSIQSIQEAAYRLRTHGLLYGLSLEDGDVGIMFNRLNEVLEDERLKSDEKHIKPELINKLQEDLIKEQLELRDKGGIFAGKEEADIRRATRTAFDIFVSSQRMAVIVARGNHLKELDAYFADPASGPLNVYNLEDLLTEKFGAFNIQEQELLRQIKLDMADDSLQKKGVNPKSMSEKEREDLGKRLFRDIFAVPDFFSSGWRIKGVLDALEERLEKENPKDFALFMRLRNSKNELTEEEKKKTPAERPELRRDVWDKIEKYRPEEIIKLFRDRDNDSLRGLYSDLHNIDSDLSPTASEESERITTYDKFKRNYGKALSILREKYFKNDVPKQINITELEKEQKELLDKALGSTEAADKAVKIFTKMKEYIDEKNMIGDLISDPKFEDIYTRTLLVDDALLNRLESDKWGEKSVTPLSEKYGADQGGDALVRIWNDTGNAIKASQHLVKFIKTENGERRAEQSLEFADAAAQYNGEENRAKIVRFTMGTFLQLSKQGFVWDVLGVGKLPFRKAMSKIEKIYGPQANPMSRDELRKNLDNLHSVLVFRAGDDPEKIKQAQKFYTDLEKLLEVTGVDIAKRRAASLLFYLILAAIIESYEVTGIKGLASKK